MSKPSVFIDLDLSKVHRLVRGEDVSIPVSFMPDEVSVYVVIRDRENEYVSTITVADDAEDWSLIVGVR